MVGHGSLAFAVRERSEIVLEGESVHSVRPDRARFGGAARQDSV